MVFNKKLRKLIRDPKLFIKDSFLFKKKQEPRKQEPRKQEPRKQEPRKQEARKQEPAIYGHATKTGSGYTFSLQNKKLINTKLGFSTLVLLHDMQENTYLINRRFAKHMLENRDFIAFREKSIYFLLEKIESNEKISEPDLFKLFLTNKDLRGNHFSDFRSVIVFNPKSELFLILRQSNPNIKIICVITSKKSCDFIMSYTEYIDILVIDKVWNIFSNKYIPRLIEFSDDVFSKLKFSKENYHSTLYPYYQNCKYFIDNYDASLISYVKLALTDSSYKKDCNLLLPIVSKTDNLEQIDEYNNNKNIEGLIKYNLNSKANHSIKSFNDFIELIDIEELYLRDNLYSIYKDMIFEAIEINNYHYLLKQTLYDGVKYEKL